MPKTLPDIIYSHDKITPIVDARTSHYLIPFAKPGEYFEHIDSYSNFLRGVEKNVRTNDRYSKYISFLKNEVHLDRCQVLKNVTDEDADIEMHHGPIYTLYDIAAIVTEYFIAKKWKTTTFSVADQILTEHQNNRIQVVMLSATIHQEVHDKNIFINMKNAYGRLDEFLKKYGPYMGNEYKEKLNNYIDRSLLYDSNDFGILKLNEALYKK